MAKLIDGETANVTGAVIVLGGGLCAIWARGTFDGAAVTLLRVFDVAGDEADPVGTKTTFTAKGSAGFELPQGARMRVDITGVGASTNLDVHLDGKYSME